MDFNGLFRRVLEGLALLIPKVLLSVDKLLRLLGNRLHALILLKDLLLLDLCDEFRILSKANGVCTFLLLVLTLIHNVGGPCRANRRLCCAAPMVVPKEVINANINTSRRLVDQIVLIEVVAAASRTLALAQFLRRPKVATAARITPTTPTQAAGAVWGAGHQQGLLYLVLGRGSFVKVKIGWLWNTHLDRRRNSVFGLLNAQPELLDVWALLVGLVIVNDRLLKLPITEVRFGLLVVA